MSTDYLNQPQNDGEASTVNRLMSAVTSQNNVEATVIQMRLDTDPIVEKIQLFLEGKKKIMEFNEQTGIKTISLIKVGEPKANAEGIHSLMFFVSSTISVPVVQGNYKDEMFRSYCAGARQSLADSILLNQHEWDISDSNFEHIIDVIMGVVEPYMTRTLDNEERKSLGQSTQYIEKVGDGGSRDGGMFGFLRGRG